MFDNEVNKLFAPSFCNSRASRKGFLIAISRAASVLTVLPPIPGPRISTQPLRNSSQSQRIFAARTSRRSSHRAPVITARCPL